MTLRKRVREGSTSLLAQATTAVDAEYPPNGVSGEGRIRELLNLPGQRPLTFLGGLLVLAWAPASVGPSLWSTDREARDFLGLLWTVEAAALGTLVAAILFVFQAYPTASNSRFGMSFREFVNQSGVLTLVGLLTGDLGLTGAVQLGWGDGAPRGWATALCLGVAGWTLLYVGSLFHGLVTRLEPVQLRAAEKARLLNYVSQHVHALAVVAQAQTILAATTAECDAVWAPLAMPEAAAVSTAADSGIVVDVDTKKLRAALAAAGDPQLLTVVIPRLYSRVRRGQPLIVASGERPPPTTANYIALGQPDSSAVDVAETLLNNMHQDALQRIIAADAVAYDLILDLYESVVATALESPELAAERKTATLDIFGVLRRHLYLQFREALKQDNLPVVQTAGFFPFRLVGVAATAGFRVVALDMLTLAQNLALDEVRSGGQQVVVWRYLMENVSYGELLYAGDTGADREQLLVASMQRMASVLIALDLAQRAEAETAWTSWGAALFTRSQPLPAPGNPVGATKLVATRDGLSVAIVAWHLHLAVDEKQPTERRQAAIRAAMRVLPSIAVPEDVLWQLDHLISLPEVEQTWSGWTWSEMPEGVAVWLESLLVGALRVAILLLAMRHVSDGGAPMEFFARVEEAQAASALEAVVAALRLVDIEPPTPSQDIIAFVNSQRQANQRQTAVEVSQRPLDQETCRQFESAVINAFEKVRRLPNLIQSADSPHTFGPAGEKSRFRLGATRALFTEKDSGAMASWLADDLGRRLDRMELGHVLEHWLDLARADVVTANADSLVDEIVAAAGDHGHRLLVIPANARLQFAAITVEERLRDVGIDVVQGWDLSDTQRFLVVVAGGGEWTLASPTSVTVEYVDEPLAALDLESRMCIDFDLEMPLFPAEDSTRVTVVELSDDSLGDI